MNDAPLALRTNATPATDMALKAKESRLFPGLSADAAAVIIAAGAEIGMGPVAALTNIHLVQGRVTLGANIIASAIKKSGKYNYRIREHTDERCVVAFLENGEEVGTSTFTKADAERAGLWGKSGPWKSFPRNMLFSRCISNGAKWYCPDVFGGSPVYTPDELGAPVNDDGTIAAEWRPATSAAPPAPTLESLLAEYGAEQIMEAAEALDIAGGLPATEADVAAVAARLAGGAS